jgi:predicted phage terminase large subunit-like protein
MGLAPSPVDEAGKLRLEIPTKMLPFAFTRRRHKVARGGRASAKSWSIARILVVKGYKRPIRWLCCRESQSSIKQSSLRILADQIRLLGLTWFYRVTSDGIYGRNGTEFTFIGLKEHLVDNVKSYEGYDGAWVAEAQGITERSANVLIPTIRKPGSEIWWDYNPDDENAYIHQRAEAALKEPHGPMLVVDINWHDNPWFSGEMEAERLAMKNLNEDLYQHIWEGKCRTKAGILFKRAWFKFYDPKLRPQAMNYYIASDYSGGPDPAKPDREPDYTEHGIFGVTPDDDIYLVDWWYGQEDPGVWIDAWIALIQKHEPLAAFEEKGVILRSVNGAIIRRMEETDTYVQRIELASAGGKLERALGFAARASLGKVYLPQGMPWATRLLNQLASFTGQDGKQDDGVDVCSIFARGLNDVDVATLASGLNKERDTDDYETDDEDEDSWKTT